MNPEIVLGPPGCGKTTRLLSLVEEELARGVPPDRVGYLAFTRRAATEAAERARTRFSLTERDLPYFRTIHSLCFQVLGLSSDDVLQGERLEQFGEWLRVPVSGRVSMEEGSSFGFLDGDRCLHMDNLARVRCIPLRQQYEEDSDNLGWAMVDHVSRGLAEYKRAHHLIDYTDMLQMFADSSWSGRLEVLFVDEAQDLSMLQWRVVEKMAQTCRRVVVAGDDDQAIYRWAGAAVDKFVGMPGQVSVLDQSWRVPAAVQDLAAEVVGQISRRRSKVWRPRPEDGVVQRVQHFSQAPTDGDVLILSRNTCFLRDLERGLRADGIVYELRGRPSISPTLLTAVRTWERLRRGEAARADDIRRVYEHMSSGRGYRRGHRLLPGLGPDDELTMEQLRESRGLLVDTIWHEALDRIPVEERTYIVSALKQGESVSGRPRVRLSTIHGAKGGEADHVVLLRDVAWRSYQMGEQFPDDEHRVWYVGATRARKTLTIVAPTTRRHRVL